MVICKCGKAIPKIPNWMASINTEFVCNNCPNRQTKNIAFMTLEAKPAAVQLPDEELAVKDAVEEDADDI